MSLVAANEGMLRGTLERIDAPFAQQMLAVLGRAMAEGAAVERGVCIVNVNRQRPTSKEPLERHRRLHGGRGEVVGLHRAGVPGARRLPDAPERSGLA